MDQHDDFASTGPMAANPAGPDPDPDLGSGSGSGPGNASAARVSRGGLGAALTSRSAGWVVATLLAGALTGLAVNVATAPSATVVRTVVRQLSVAAPGGLGRIASLRCQVLMPGPRIIFPPAKGGSPATTVPSAPSVPSSPSPHATASPSPHATAGQVKARRAGFTVLPPQALAPSCALRLGLVAPGVQCLVGRPAGARFSIHAIGRGRQVIVGRLAPVKIHGQAAKLPRGVRVPPGVQFLPGAPLVCGG